MEAKYYKKPENVIFLDPTIRLLAKLFGAKYFVMKCEVCKKIPTEFHGKRCLNHINKT